MEREPVYAVVERGLGDLFAKGHRVLSLWDTIEGAEIRRRDMNALEPQDKYHVVELPVEHSEEF